MSAPFILLLFILSPFLPMPASAAGPRRVSRASLLALLSMLSGCATLGQIGALQRVDFSIGGVSSVRLAGIELDRVRSFSDLSLADGARLAAAVRDRRVPLAMDVGVVAENPADNFSDARLLRMDWTLLLEDRETVSGSVTDEIVLPRGTPTSFPIAVELDLVDFFEGSARDLFELALSLTGSGGDAKNVELRAMPFVDTPLGPIAYPEPIRIVRATVGG